MIRALRLAGLALALSLAALGAWAVNQPSRPHGPIGFDPLSPLGALALAVGMLALRALARGPAVYAVAALLMAAAAGGNFFFYPPIPDGAYFLVRYGHSAAAELWPASAAWHVIAFAGVAWSLARIIEGGPPANVWRGAREASLLVLLVLVGAVALDRFTETLPQVASSWPLAILWLAGMAVAATAAWLARRNPLAPLAAVFLSLLTLLAAATLALYQYG